MEEERLETADGLRIPEAGVSGGIVPAPSTSSSYEGPAVSCSAGEKVENTTAMIRMRRILKAVSDAATGIATSHFLFKESEAEANRLKKSFYSLWAFLAYHDEDEQGYETAKPHLVKYKVWDESFPAGVSPETLSSALTKAFDFIREWDKREAYEGILRAAAWSYRKLGIKTEDVPEVFAAELFVSVAELLGDDLPPTMQEDSRATKRLEQLGIPWIPGTAEFWRSGNEDETLNPTGLKGGGKPLAFRGNREKMDKQEEEGRGRRKRYKPCTYPSSSSEEEDEGTAEREGAETPISLSTDEMEEGEPVRASTPPPATPGTEDPVSLSLGGKESGEPNGATTLPPTTSRTEDPQPGPSTQVEGLPPPTVDFEDCLITSGEDEGMEDGTTAPPSTSTGIPSWVPAGERTDPSKRFASARRAQGRPRKDGTGPFIDSETEELEMVVRGETASEEEEIEVVPPSLTGPQKREAARSIQKMERGSTEELYKSFDRKLLTIEQIRQCSRNIRGQQSGRIKMNVFVLREVLKTLTSRAAHGGDPGFWKARYLAEKRSNATLKAQVRQIDTQMKLQRVDLAEMREREREREREGRRQPCEPMLSPTRGVSPLPRPSTDGVEEISPAQEGGRDEGMECDSVPQIPIEISLKGIMEALQTLTSRMEKLESGISEARLPPSASHVVPTAPGRGAKGQRKKKRTTKAPLKKDASGSKKAKRAEGGRGAGEIPPPPSEDPPPGAGNAAGPLAEGESTGVDPRNPPTETWATVAGKRGRRANTAPQAAPPAPSAIPASQKKEERKKMDRKTAIKKAKKRLPRSAAILISVKEPDTLSGVIRKAQESISLEQLGITQLRMKSSFGGGLFWKSQERGRMPRLKPHT
ncbi:uncharacterized protein [Linepithema humile]|uniref:uncharacterized protein n=1 Tax=Linepithema humile TaxID=83485 RepID=UPI00351E87E9